MRVTNMKYVINIKRKPSIIKKEKREWGEEEEKKRTQFMSTEKFFL
jgi:hypothetical protein